MTGNNMTVDLMGFADNDALYQYMDELLLAVQPSGKKHPLQYLVLVRESEHYPEILADIKSSGGQLKTRHLCMALGVDKLTVEQRRFITRVTPDFLDFYQDVCEAIEWWPVYRNDFRYMKPITGKQLHTFFELPTEIGGLHLAKWFKPDLVLVEGLSNEEVIWAVYDAVCGSERHIEASFTLDYVKNAGHLRELYSKIALK